MSTITYANVNTNVNADTNADTNADENINVDNFTLLSVLRSRLTGQNTHLHCTGTFLNPNRQGLRGSLQAQLGHRCRRDKHGGLPAQWHIRS
jgi:hypothetical protein